jgi:hypothetical protein
MRMKLEGTPNQSVERTAAPLCREHGAGSSTATGFGGRRGRAAVAHLHRSAEKLSQVPKQITPNERRSVCQESKFD